MRFDHCDLSGAWIVTTEPHGDERGHFGRTFCREEFAQRGIAFQIDQISRSFNTKAGTVRGMHFQRAPKGEDKLIHCLRGAVHDVIVDLRPESDTYCRTFSIELTADNDLSLFVPRGFAHGFQTLADNTELLYCIATPHSPEHASGVRWDDPAFDIKWPRKVTSISPKDQSFEDFCR